MKTARDTLSRVERALRMVTVPFPHLSGLVAAATVSLDERLPTMGVFASGRLAVNPSFVARLSDGDLTFVLAHEMLHLALRTHDRARGASRLEFNYAHDYIINDMLRAELGVSTIPANGLDMPGAREKSAEAIVLEMRRREGRTPSRSRVWEGEATTAQRRFADGAAGEGSDDDGDVLPDEVERAWYPQDAARQRNAVERTRALAARSLSLAQAMGALRGARGSGAGSTRQEVGALRGLYRTPWRLVLQRWIESVAPAERTFARPSRRIAPDAEIVLPGRRRCGWLLNVVLDTSASMTAELPKALGAIADLCEAAGVDQVRLVQCDASVTSDEWLPVDALASREIAGFGGSDLSPALLHLAADPQTRAAIVVTDGDVAYPPDPLPYDVLWVVTDVAAAATFRPPYGRVVPIADS